jgi:arylformamidase
VTRLRDISQPLRPDLPVWPGDTRLTLARTWAMGVDCPVNVASLTLSTHAGTHADAPLHYAPEGVAIDELRLEPYLGECLVLDLRGVDQIRPEHLAGVDLAGVERVLFRTYDRFPHTHWRSNFTTIAPDAVALLAGVGVRLIGLDSPSLDPEDSKTLGAHQAVAAAGLRVLEGLVLDDVPAGRYELIALPLKLAGGDAAPVRAVLRDLP